MSMGKQRAKGMAGYEYRKTKELKVQLGMSMVKQRAECLGVSSQETMLVCSMT